MPLKKSDAERALALLWEFRSVADETEDRSVDQAALGKAISMLHAYLTDVLPATQRRVKISLDQRAIEVTIAPQLDLQWVEMDCKANRELGIHLQSLDGLVRAQSNFCPVYISRINKASVAEREGVLKRGDIVVEVNQRSLMHVSLDRARWLLKSAARTGKVSLAVITADGRRIHQRWKSTPRPPNKRILRTAPAPPPPPRQEKLKAEVHQTPVEGENQPLKPAWQSGTYIPDHRNSLTPSVGSHDSSYEVLVNTVEVAAHISRSSFRYSQRKLKGMNRKPRKITIEKDADGLGMKLMGGKGSRFGDVGIFVAEIVPGKAADRDGRLKQGDELLMVNGKSVVGLTRLQVVEILKGASTVQLLIATKRSDDGMSEVSSMVSVDSIAESEIHQMLQSRDEIKRVKSPPKLLSRMVVSASSLHTRISTASNGLVSYSGGASSPSFARMGKKAIQQLGKHSSTNTAHKGLRHPPQVETCIVLVKSAGGKPFGFSLCGGKGSKRGNVGLYVRSIQDGGLAAEDGRLQVGDEILEVNGQLLEGNTHKKAAGIIKGLVGVVNFRVRTGPGYLDIPNKLKRSLSVKGTSIRTTIRKARGETLGLVIAGLTDNTDEYGVFIKHIIPNSPADRCKMLRRCDQLVAINDHSLLDLSVQDAQELLVAQQRLSNVEVNLHVVRPYNINALEQLLLEIESPTKDYQRSHGSFRMKTEASESSSMSDDAQPPPTSPLDKDIIDLFVPGVKGSEYLHENQVTGEEEFPSVVDVIQEFQDQQDEEDTILKSLTPILTRPSIASGYDRKSLVYDSDTSQQNSPRVYHESIKKPTSKEIEMKALEDKSWKRSSLTTSFYQTKPDSFPDTQAEHLSQSNGLLLDHQEYEETVFTTLPDTDEDPMGETATVTWTPDFAPPEAPPQPPSFSPPAASPALTEMEASQRIPQGFQQLCLAVKWHGKRSIGVTLVNSHGETNGYPQVKRVFPRGMGDKSGLKVRDRLVSLNGQDLKEIPTKEILKKLAEVTKETELIIWRDLNYDADGASSGYSQSMGYSESVTSVTTTTSEDGTTDSVVLSAPEIPLSLSVSKSSNSEALLPSIQMSSQDGIVDTQTTLNTELKEEAALHDQSVGPSLPVAESLMETELFTESLPPTSAPAHLPPSPSSSRVSPPLPSSPPPTAPTAVNQELPCRPPLTSIVQDPSHPPPVISPESPPPPSFPSPPEIINESSVSAHLPPSLKTHQSPPLPARPPPFSIPQGSPTLPSHPPPSTPIDGSPSLPSHPLPLSVPCESPPLPFHPPPSTPVEFSPPLRPFASPPTNLLEKSPLNQLLPTIPSSTASPEINVIPSTPKQTHPPKSEWNPVTQKDTKENGPPSGAKDGQPWSLPQAEPSSSENRIRSLGPVPKGERQENAPFEIEVARGLFSLGLSIEQDQKTDMIVVKSIASRSNLAKNGNLRPCDVLLSVNDKNFMGLSLSEAESTIKSLPRGVVKIVAMPPPRDVTVGVTPSATKQDEGGSVTQTQSHIRQTLAKSSGKTSSKTTDGERGLEIGNLEPMTPPPIGNGDKGQKNEEEGVITVTLTRQGGVSLGIEVEGGSDTAQKNIYISRLLPGSPAALCGQLQRGDQLIMVGNECVVGTTSVEAWGILTEASKTVEIVVARKKENIENLKAFSPVESPAESLAPLPSMETIPTLKHRVASSSSLHYTTTFPRSPSFQQSFHSSSEDIREDPLDSSLPLTMAPMPSPPKPNTETLTIVLKKEEGQRLGFSIKGGSDNIKLPNVHVKAIDVTSVAGEDGRLRRGDKILTVNGHPLEGMTYKAALAVIKDAGNMVTLEVFRRTTHGSFPVASSRITSKIQSRQGSGESSPAKSSGSPSPITIRRKPSYAALVGTQSSQGVKMVELHKGPTGLGMHLKGSLLQEPPLAPITVKEVLPGGVAYKSGKINIGDQILEVNGVLFEGMTQAQAVRTIKATPQGIVRLVLLDKRYTAFL